MMIMLGNQDDEHHHSRHQHRHRHRHHRHRHHYHVMYFECSGAAIIGLLITPVNSPACQEILSSSSSSQLELSG